MESPNQKKMDEKPDAQASTSAFDEDEEEEEIVTMVDVLERESEQEADVNAVLGGADDKNCTYSQGYVNRQPLYACKTCSKGKPAGVCLACSYNCHEGHDLIELYTKRNFRCDCGNSLFGGNKCSLDCVKDEINENNSYNQNFEGLYCTCHRPYPDPEDTEEDVMIQCIVCEDWYHGRHLETKDQKLESEGEANEMICQLCMKSLPFLESYVGLEGKKTSGDVCKLSSAPSSNAGRAAVTTTFWPIGWREVLCRCNNCLELYQKNKVSYLLEEKDSVVVYEKQNKERQTESQYERGMRALSSLDRVQQVEAIQGYNEMKNALMEHLQKFVGSKKVVSETDIREFFDEMNAKRRRVLVPPTCR